ncbi:MAG: hypothetical protein Q9163_001267 [Psora crenata]
MHILNVTLFTLLAFTFSVPLGAPLATTSAFPTTATLPARYYLKTKVAHGGDKAKDGLYVSGYHTGAGLNDVTLEDISVASIGFLNDTYQQFDYNTTFPWSLDMGGDTNYAAWEFVGISAGQTSSGFMFNETGLQWDYGVDGFDGWLAWQGLPPQPEDLQTKNLYSSHPPPRPI